MDPLSIAMLALGGLQTGVGITQLLKGDKLGDAASRPFLDIPPEFDTNQNIAESQAQQGLSDEAKQSLKQDAERGLTASLDTISSTGVSNPNIVSGLFDDYFSSLSKTAVMDSQLKDQKIRDLYGINEDKGNMKLTQFLYNEDSKFKDKQQLAATLGQQGTANIFGGIDQGLGTIASKQSGDVLQDLIAELKMSNTGYAAPTSNGSTSSNGISNDQLLLALNKLFAQ